MDTDLEKFIQSLPPTFSDSFKETLMEISHVFELKKGETVVDDFFHNTKAYYILKGSCVRYIITSQGNEKAIMFHTEKFMPIMGNAYIKSENSVVSYLIKANERTKVIAWDMSLGVKYAITDAAYVQFAANNALNMFSIQNQLQNHLTGLSSEEFLKWLLKNYNFIPQRFSFHDIANFMGITPTWLSLLKRKLAQK